MSEVTKFLISGSYVTTLREDTMVGKTISEKIMERVCVGKPTPGEVAVVKPDFVMAYSGITVFPPLFEGTLKEIGITRILNPEKAAVFIDHLDVPSAAEEAEKVRQVKEAVKKQRIKYLFDREGIGHQIAVDKCLSRPGMMAVHFDRHVSTLGALGAYAVGIDINDLLEVYATGETHVLIPKTLKIELQGRTKLPVMGRDVFQYVLDKIGPDGGAGCVVEFTGSGVRAMSMDSRLTMCNLIQFCGAETAIIGSDETMLQYLKERSSEPFHSINSDPDAHYYDTREYDVSAIEPQVAVPPDVSNVKPVSEIAGKEITQAMIGTCASGRLEDLRMAARILDGKGVNDDVKMLITPGSSQIYLEAAKEGLVEKLLSAGATITRPTCDSCYGRLGYLTAGEVCIASATLNQPGRMGSTDAEIYLASSATVAASAVEGKIADPRKYVEA